MKKEGSQTLRFPSDKKNPRKDLTVGKKFLVICGRALRNHHFLLSFWQKTTFIIKMKIKKLDEYIEYIALVVLIDLKLESEEIIFRVMFDYG